MVTRIFCRSDGFITVNTAVDDADINEIISKWEAANNGVKVIKYVAINKDEFPISKEFRNAWSFDGDSVKVNMAKARDIHRDKLRMSRSIYFEPLERAQRQALTIGDMKSAKSLELKLQSLRDITSDPKIESAQTPYDLFKAAPDWATFIP